MKSQAASVVALTLVMCGHQSWIPAYASAWCQMTTDAPISTSAQPCDTNGIPLHWLRKCNSYAFDKDGSNDLTLADVRSVFSQAFATWENVICASGKTTGMRAAQLTDTITCKEGASFNLSGPNVQAVSFVSDWGERGYDDAAFAQTTVWHNERTGEVLDVDMEVNEERGPYGICPDDGCKDGRTVDLRNVITHEAGHYFGLAHDPDDADATMARSSGIGEVKKRDLAASDKEGFCAIYGKGDLPSACDTTPRGGLAKDCTPDSSGSGLGCSTSGAPKTSPISFASSLMGLGWLLRRRRERRFLA